VTETPILRGDDLSKSFGVSHVLKNVTLAVPRNSVVGVVGENGAGKSTLFNLLSGILQPDRGHIELDGRTVRFGSYREAMLLGISRVFQEQALIGNIAVYENILLSHEGRFARFGQVLDRRHMAKVAQRIVDAFGLDIDVRRRTDDYDFSIRQSIEIARACLVPREVLGVESPVVLLDEPTSALAKSEEEALFRMIRNTREHGSVLFVSHRLSEVLSVSDIIYVIKDGHIVANVDPKQADQNALHRLMVGRERDADYYHEGEQIDVSGHPELLEVRGLRFKGAYDGITFNIRAGEVVGIGGLLDSGKSALGKGVAGVIPPHAGTVALDGSRPQRPQLRRLIAEGLAYVPAERLREGIIASFSIATNISLASGGDLFSTPYGVWRTAAEHDVSSKYIRDLEIRGATLPEVPCAELSGGNQQKVALAKWLCRSPRVLVLDNPTRGVDAGAKEEIYQLIRDLATDGAAILLITDELLELIGLSNRIAIMRHGRIIAALAAPPNQKPTEHELVGLMTGT